MGFYGAITSFTTTALAAQLSILAAQEPSQVAPFYPEKWSFPSYDPARFVKNPEATAKVAGAIVKESSFVKRIDLDGDWKISGLENAAEPFKDDADLAKGFGKKDFDDSSWSGIKVPLNWYKKYPQALKKESPYVKGWYRRSVEIPADAANKRVMIRFGVVGYEALLFVNGQEAGRHKGDFTPFETDITKFVKPGEKAVLALRVFSDFGPAFGLKTPAKHAYGSQWSISNIRGGVWQSAEIRIEPELRVVSALISPDLKSSSISVDCVVRNDSAKTVEANLLEAVKPAESALAKDAPAAKKTKSVKLAPGETKLNIVVKLEKPRLWTPESPNLYHLILPLEISGKAISATTFRFGFRDFKSADAHFLLNGKRVYLFGENIPAIRFGGDGVYSEELRAAFADYMLRFKANGYNIVRNPHMPFSYEGMEVADEVGMMIYDEWAWSFTKSLDPVEFEKNNLREIAEWVERDYNNPSCVLWSCGNEVFYGENDLTIKNLNKQVELIRRLDKSGRPVSTFSGAAHGYGTRKLETDVLDLHSYLGLGNDPWPFWEKMYAGVEKGYLKEYGRDGKMPIPFIIWECVGFSWGMKADKAFSTESVEDYIKYTRKPTSWGQPEGIGWSGSIGLAAALDPARGASYGMAQIGRRILDFVRQNVETDGFAPWFHNADLAMSRIWNQPLYCGLRGEGSVPLRNVFSGAKYSQTAFVVSSIAKDFEGCVFKVVLKELDGSEKTLASWDLGKIAAWTKGDKELEFAIPAGGENRWAQLRASITDKSGAIVSRNFYDVFVAKPELRKIAAKGGVGVLATGSEGEKALLAILAELGVEAKKISSPDELKDIKALIAPPCDAKPALMNAQMIAAVSHWIRNGGSYLSLEQGWRGADSLLGRQFIPVHSVFADLAVYGHPAFKGLSQANFEFWNNPDFGQTATTAMAPVSIDLIAARGPMLAQRETFAVLSDGRFAQGRITASQFEAVKLWRKDSAATIYLENLIESVCGPMPKGLKDWTRSTDETVLSKDAKIVQLDLSKVANMGFKDEKDGDGKGGWTDQGENDFRMMPLGRQTLAKIPFDIIDPASNGGKSCVIMTPNPKGDLVKAAKGIKLEGKFRRIFFLHTAAWISSTGTVVAYYTVHYADGSKELIPVRDGVNICDWWHCGSLPEAKLALAMRNPAGNEVGLTMMEWSNPHPEKEIKSIDLSANTGDEIDFAAAASSKAVTAVVAVSAETAANDALRFDAKKWSVLAEAGPGKLIHEGASLPKAEAAPSEGSDAFKIVFPKREEGSPNPVVFTFMPPAAKAKLKNSAFRYFVADVKADFDATLLFRLPKDDWKDSLAAPAHIRGDGLWHSVRIRLDEDMKLDQRKWGLSELRGEFFIFGDGKKQAKPLSFTIKNARLE